MSGHSKWSTIKHKKAKTDAVRGKLFSKLIKEITVAAKHGGGDLDSNPRLRTAVLTAKAANMPKSNIEQAIKKGTGELPGVNYEEHTYEGYGPGGAALFIEVLTDNKNRTTAEIRYVLDRRGGNLGTDGCVAWLFERRGLVTIEAENKDEDAVLDDALELGAEDVSREGNIYEIYTAPADVAEIRQGLETKGYTVDESKISMIPKTTQKLERKEAEQMLKLMESLEDHDDVQNVFSNFDIADDILEEMSA
ncbi:MAG TPA: YebC/PmpR family DNA-binding transcriptional regulator [bacterium]|nr:YebC/PmpR family DNA-binding transcriptional regulator [bacterium]